MFRDSWAKQKANTEELKAAAATRSTTKIYKGKTDIWDLSTEELE